jgi:Recombination endonuclease VII
MSDEEWMAEPVVDVPEPKRKRRKFRKYARPVCSAEQWRAILDLQQARCAICGEERELYQDHSYRTGKTRGGLCRKCNCALGMLKDSPSRLKRALAYLRNPLAKALSFGESEKERTGL